MHQKELMGKLATSFLFRFQLKKNSPTESPKTFCLMNTYSLYKKWTRVMDIQYDLFIE